MKKYRFRLEALLKMKEHFEKEKQKELAKAKLQVLTQENNLIELSDIKKRTLCKQTLFQKVTFTVAEMLVYGRYLMKLKRETIAGDEMLKVLNKNENNKRVDLLEASRERKILDKLKEKQKSNFISEFEKLETKELDEIAGNSYRANRSAK